MSESAVPLAERTPDAVPIDVLFVDGDPDYLAALEGAIAGRPGVAVHTESDPRAALARIADVDCVVSDAELPGHDGRELLAAVRQRDPRIPFVFHTDLEFDAVADDVLAADRTEYVRKGRDASDVDLLRHRIDTLVENVRLTDARERLRAAVEACRTPILVVDDEGTIAHANGRLSSALAGDDLEGRPWEDLFSRNAADRIRTDAIPIGSEGWNWTGATTLAACDGEEIRARTDLVRLADGGLVFAFHDLDRGGEA